jgi:pimeloyl-ACP methyl ester carboxylesterase
MTIAGEVLDIDAAVKFLQYRGYSEFGIVAASFAGGPVSNYASEAPTFFKAVVMWNALVDYDAILNPKLAWPKRYFNKAAMKKLAKNGFLELGRSRKFRIGKALVVEMMMLKPWKDLQKVACPILFIHGDKDTYVPYKDSVKYSKKMDNARLVTIKGAEHGFHDKKEESEQADSATVTFFLENMR